MNIAWNEDYLQQKMTSATTDQIFPKFELDFKEPNKISIVLEMKTTFNGRRPQNIKSGISSQQPQIRSYSDFNLSLRD